MNRLVLPLPALPADPERRSRPLLMANITVVGSRFDGSEG